MTTTTTTTNHRDRVRKCSCTPGYSPWAWIHNVACDLLDESVELHDYFNGPDSNHVYGVSFRFVSSETDERLVTPRDVKDRSLERWFATDTERRHFVEVEGLFDVRQLPYPTHFEIRSAYWKPFCDELKAAEQEWSDYKAQLSLFSTDEGHVARARARDRLDKAYLAFDIADSGYVKHMQTRS